MHAQFPPFFSKGMSKRKLTKSELRAYRELARAAAKLRKAQVAAEQQANRRASHD